MPRSVAPIDAPLTHLDPRLIESEQLFDRLENRLKRHFRWLVAIAIGHVSNLLAILLTQT